jgi:ATP-dependent RNA helicase DDX3X
MADSGWDDADPSSTLADVTPANGQPSGPTKIVEAIQRAKEAGWGERQTYNYHTTAPKAFLNGDGHEAKSDSAADADANGEEALVSVYASKPTTWSHDIARYEWKDEYGDVGPRIESLEKELFHGEFLNRAGSKLEK